MQGQVSAADRRSGRNRQGYSCNLSLEGQFQGQGAGLVDPSYGHCVYMATNTLGLGLATVKSKGVQVLDASNPDDPRLTSTLTSPAMLTGTWESLKVNQARGILAGVAAAPVVNGLLLDLYDIKDDCAHPRLLNQIHLSNTGGSTNGSHSDLPIVGGIPALSLPANVLGHEGGWSPDGKTYWTSSFAAASLSAIDVSDPTQPHLVYTGLNGLPLNHGFSVSPDGNRLYLATAFPAGFIVLDVSDVQARRPLPVLREVSHVSWSEIGVGQGSIPITYGGAPYLVTFDELSGEGVRIYNIGDERRPELVKHLQLEIQQDGNVDARRADTTGNGTFGYEAHYCDVDRTTDPTALACGYFNSGVRVFNIRNPREPREIAYFNPPAQVGKNLELGGSDHSGNLLVQTPPPITDVKNLNVGNILGQGLLVNMSADYCTSPPRFVGRNRLWVTCMDNGFLALKFTNNSYSSPGSGD